MNPNREEVLFALALEKPVEKRAAFLEVMCEGDSALHARLEALFAAHEQPETLLATQAEAVRPTIKLDLAEEPPDEAVGQTLGRYKLLERVGEGGCGVVYVAEQTEPVRRRVALKVIKLGMDTKQVVARFEAERQALAMMDHPNIAKVLDAGTTELGRPFFVMELVRGIRITDYCDQSNLTTKDRLDLFIKVCQAIQHAHQKGIIHRDIKPSNILVTLHDGVPVPKVIDFGIAKATEGGLTDNTVYTQLHQFIGTPAYMSPEQAEMSGLDIDTRSDIYSLGVLLYELLAGSTPFDAAELMESGIDAMRKTIREKEPPRPSTRLTQELLATGRAPSPPAAGEEGRGEEGRLVVGAVLLPTRSSRGEGEDPRRLHQLKHLIPLIKGDLDWIVMKCLEKDRTRRYDTANGLAFDLKRHLNNEPVLARPPSAAYRFQKLLRRNKVMSAAVVLVLTAILVGSLVSIGQALRARRELRRALTAEAQAQAEKANAQAALHFIQDDVLSQANPGFQPDRDLKVRTLLDRVGDRLDRAAGRPPLVEASIRQTLGSVYTELGDYTKAVQHYEAALRLQRQHLGENDLETLRSLHGLSMAYWWGGDIAKAEPLTRQGLEASRRVLGDKNLLTLQFMQARAFTICYLGETAWSEVEGLFLEALAKHREVLGREDPATLRLIYGIGLSYNLNQQDGKGAPLVEEALDNARRVLDEKNPYIADLSSLLSGLCLDLNQLETGEALARRAVELRRQTLGEGNPKTIGAIVNLAMIHLQQGRLNEAGRLTDLVLQTSRQLPVENSPFLPNMLGLLGWLYLEQGDLAKADTICTLAMEAMRRKPNANPIVYSFVMARLGSVRLAQGQWVEAEVLLREGSRRADKHFPDAGYRFYLISLLGGSLTGQAKFDEAEPLLRQGYEGLVQRQSTMPLILNAPRRVTEALERLVQLYDAWGKPTQAAEWKQKLAAFQQAAKVSDNNSKTP